MLHAPLLPSASPQDALARLEGGIDRLRPLVERHITPERVLRYLKALADTPAPSTAASALRGPVLRQLLREDRALGSRLTLDCNYANSAGTVIEVGAGKAGKPLWFFAHLDAISYLVGPAGPDRQPLVPFCYHLTTEGRRDALCLRFDARSFRYEVASEGALVSENGLPFFEAADPTFRARSGDRIVPVTPVAPLAGDRMNGHFDNAGGAAALAVAAPVLAEAGFDALLAFPDEEEGPHGSGNQIIGRGGFRIIDRLAPPDLAVVVDMQQAEAGPADGTGSGVRLGRGAVLSEFASLGRGAVMPPHLLGAARALVERIRERGVPVQEPQSSYTSRSDDVSVMLKTPNILLLGFPGLNRHFDADLPEASLNDIVSLSKALAYSALLRPLARALADGWDASKGRQA